MLGNRSDVYFVRGADGRWEATCRLAFGEEGDRISRRRVALAVNASPTVSVGLGERFEDPVPALLTPEFVKAFDGFVRPELRVVLKRPPGRRLEDSFYASVADAYRDAVSRGLNPRKIISEDAGVSTDVAGRWIYEARKRKHLAPGAPGKVTT